MGVIEKPPLTAQTLLRKAMAKGNKKVHRHLGDDSDEEDAPNEQNKINPKDMDFSQRREIHRKDAAEKRRSRMKCNLCGRPGHLRKECLGIDDDGRGESKYTKSKGDPGSLLLKQSTSSKNKGAKNRGRKHSKSDVSESELVLPPGFLPVRGKGKEESMDILEPYFFYDAGCDNMATIDYLRSGRRKNKLSMKEAVTEYQSVLEAASSISNYGGCISRSYLKQVQSVREAGASPQRVSRH